MKLQQLLNNKKNLLSIYCTAGFPQYDDLPVIISSLEKAGVDFVEIGIPYSDPLCDGPTIQASSSKALHNGINLQSIFDQLATVNTTMPLIMMGYFNVVFQFGIEAFCAKCQAVGIEGVILPDLPIDLYESKYKSIFEAYGLHLIFLITPQTSDERIRKIDQLSQSFIYAVSTASTTGNTKGIQDSSDYLQRTRDLNLQHPFMVGFNISKAEDFQIACQYGSGGIIGSAFIKAIAKGKEVEQSVAEFIHQIKN